MPEPMFPARRQWLCTFGSLATLGASGAGFAQALGQRESLAPASRLLGPLSNLVLDYAGFLLTGMGSTPLASARLSVTASASRYSIRLSVESFLADLGYESQGRLDAAGLHPQYYAERRKLPFRSRRLREARYRETTDPARVNTRDGEVLLVPPGTQDRLSLIFQYSLLARADPRIVQAGHEQSIPFAGTSDVNASRWSADPPEWIRPTDDENASAGRRQANRIARIAEPGSNGLDVAFWLSANDKRLPLVLQFSEGGRSLRFESVGVR
ncbi:MAG: DUF3108 domain-containing protein [Burkholderiaceae bacterium]